MQDLAPAKAKAMLAAQDPPRLLDVREPWEHAVARLQGSTLIPMREIPARLGELNLEQPVIVYCHHGMRSRQVAGFLEQKGFTAVFNLAGGIDAWSREVDPTVSIY